MQHNGTGHSESDEMRGQRDQETSEPQTKKKIHTKNCSEV